MGHDGYLNESEAWAWASQESGFNPRAERPNQSPEGREGRKQHSLSPRSKALQLEVALAWLGLALEKRTENMTFEV